jgi:hypothetical protein
LTALLVIIQTGMLAFVVVGFRANGLTYQWTSAAADVLVPLAFLLGWAYFAIWPGRQRDDWVTAEMFLVMALFMSISAIAPPGQYAALAFKRPLIDATLAAVDGALGVHVPTWAAWLSQNRWLLHVLLYAYLSLLVQFFVPIFVLGLWYRDRGRLWEYAFHFHVCSVITLACFALWPVAGAFTHNGFEPSFDLSRFIEQFNGVYSGARTAIRPEDMEGLVSMPSFHFAGAMMVTWAMRQSRIWLVVLIPLNLTLTAATVVTGSHYLADLIGAAAMCGLSLWLYRWFAFRWVGESGVAATNGSKGHEQRV